MASIVYALILLFFIITLSVLITQNVIIPSVINYEHGLLNHPDFTIGKSGIEGLGLYTKRRRLKGEKLFVAINSNKIVTKVGSKINHCPGKFKNQAEAAYSAPRAMFLQGKSSRLIIRIRRISLISQIQDGDVICNLSIYIIRIKYNNRI